MNIIDIIQILTVHLYLNVMLQFFCGCILEYTVQVAEKRAEESKKARAKMKARAKEKEVRIVNMSTRIDTTRIFDTNTTQERRSSCLLDGGGAFLIKKSSVLFVCIEEVLVCIEISMLIRKPC